MIRSNVGVLIIKKTNAFCYATCLRNPPGQRTGVGTIELNVFLKAITLDEGELKPNAWSSCVVFEKLGGGGGGVCVRDC